VPEVPLLSSVLGLELDASSPPPQPEITTAPASAAMTNAIATMPRSGADRLTVMVLPPPIAKVLDHLIAVIGQQDSFALEALGSYRDTRPP